MRYLIYVVANPCAVATGMWLSEKIGWTRERPKNNNGWASINDAYKRLERLYSTHNETCGCIFEIREVEA